MKIEELIEKHRPSRRTENEPCSPGSLFHLNSNGLIEEAVDRQARRGSPTGLADDAERPLVITRIVAWEVLAEAQRNGLRLRPARIGPELRARSA